MTSAPSELTPTSVPAGENADASPSFAPPNSPRRGPLASTWKGAITGFRWFNLIFRTLCALVLTLGIAITALGVGAGRGWGVAPIIPGAIVVYLVLVTCGAVAGGVLGLIVGAIRYALPGKRADPAPSPIEIKETTDVVAVSQRRRRWPWVISSLAALAVAVGFGLGAYLGGLVDHRLAAAIAAADRDDPHWRLNDLMEHRASVPEAENSAIVVAKVLSALPKGWPDAQIAKSSERLSEITENIRLDDTTAATLKKELEKRGAAVKIGRTIGGYERGRHEVKLGPALIDTLLPETQSARMAALLLTIDAAVRADSGDADGAIDSCRAILGVARSIGDEPFMISQLVRISIGDVALLSARRALGHGEPSDAALARLEALVLEELAEPLLFYGIKGERATVDELIRRVGAGEIAISALGQSGPMRNPAALQSSIAPWGKLMYDNQRALALTWFNQAISIARQPAAERSTAWALWQNDIVLAARSQFAEFTAKLAVKLTPRISDADFAHSRYLANLGATAILLAAERHRRKTGHWPAAIAAIEPEFLATAPLDPFSGEPFRMERTKDEVIFYSVGRNHEDEHGQADRKKQHRGQADDIVARGWDVAKRHLPPKKP